MAGSGMWCIVLELCIGIILLVFLGYSNSWKINERMNIGENIFSCHLFFSNLNNPKKRQEEEIRNDYDNYFNLYLQKYTLLHIMHKIIAQNCTTQLYVSPVTNTSKHVIMVITYANWFLDPISHATPIGSCTFSTLVVVHHPTIGKKL